MSYSAVVLADGPAGYWRLGESSGTTAADASGNARTGTYSGTYTQGTQGIPGVSGNTAVTFTGTAGAQVAVPWNAAFNYATTGGLTIELWYKGTAVGSNAGSGTVGSTCGLVCASTDTSNKFWGVTVTDLGKVRMFYSSSYFIVTGGVTVNDGNWHHIVVTITTGATFTITIYVDGVVDTTTTTATGGVGGGTPSITIANNPRAATHVAPGTVDEVAIYPSTLTPTRVAAHYSVGSGTHAEMAYKVQLDVSGSTFGTTFAPTDVTASAAAGMSFEPITVNWGRQDQYTAINPSTVSGELINSDGTFSPGNASGTYYPHIRRGLRRRVSVGVNGTTVNLSEDYATSLEIVPAKDSLAVTKIDGADILAGFGATASSSAVNAPSVGTTMRSFLAEEMLLDAPSCLYLLQEADGSTSFADVTGTQGTAVIGNSSLGAGVVAAGQTPTSGVFEGGTFVDITNAAYSTSIGTARCAGSYLEFTHPDLSAVTSYSYEVWVTTLTSPPGQNAAVLSTQPGPIFAVESTGVVIFSALAASATTAKSICDGGVHQIVGVVTGGVGSTVYIDGVLAASAAGTGSGGFGVLPTTLGMSLAAPGSTAGFLPFSGGVSHAAIYPTALSAARVLAHYQAGTTTLAGERTDQRVARLLSYRANSGSTLDTGLGTMGVQNIAGRSLQDCLLEVAQTEAGALYIDGTGKVNFRSRSRLFNPTPSVTLNMASGGVNFGSNWREDTQNVINDATVTNSTTGSEQRFYNASSISSDGEYSTSVSLPLNADSDALNMAGWLVVNGVQQQLTATPLIVDLLHITAAQAQAVLQLAPLDCIQLTGCPTPAPASTMTFIVQGGSISLAADAATATLNLTPLPYPVGVWDSTNWDATNATWSF